jgi:hypothetical protein
LLNLLFQLAVSRTRMGKEMQGITNHRLGL